MDQPRIGLVHPHQMPGIGTPGRRNSCPLSEVQPTPAAMLFPLPHSPTLLRDRAEYTLIPKEIRNLYHRTRCSPPVSIPPAPFVR